jgi:hypothetical protein
MAGRRTFKPSQLTAPAVMMLAFWALGITLALTVHPFFFITFGFNAGFREKLRRHGARQAPAA